MNQEEKPITKVNSSYMQKYDAHMERQKKKRQRLTRRLITFAVVVTIIFGSMATYHIKQRALHAEKAEEYEQQEDELATLQSDQRSLEEEIELLNDEDYILDIARTNYFLSKEGELIFKIPNKDPSY